MDQVKIGNFIASLRKEKSMTQQQLADALDVSNKAVSKWECGKGLPELSVMTSLCMFFEISVNEFISGERIESSHFPERADENLVLLIEEAKSVKRDNIRFILSILASLIVLMLFIWYIFVASMGVQLGALYFDSTSLIGVIGITGVLLLATGHIKPFFCAVPYVINSKTSNVDLRKSYSAVKLAGQSFLGSGALITCIGFMSMQYSGTADQIHMEDIGFSVSMSLNGILLGLIGYLILLPFQAKLYSRIAESQD